MKVLVTGGAGYIGSFMVRKLKEMNHEVVILDNLSYGHVEAVKDFDLRKIDLVTEKEKVQELFKSEKFDACIHMASFIQMGESYVNPSKYYNNNVIGFINLIDAMVANDCKKLIISSTAGVYGNPTRLPIEEDDPKNPLNAYGESKYMFERIIDDYDTAYGLKYVAFRYFNAAGAALDGSIGEAHSDESHLIPNVIRKALGNEEIEIYGNDYKTADGTGVRDYVHVLDLAEVHELALKYLEKGQSNIFNVGIGKGYSNKEILDKVKEISGIDLKIKYIGRRQGDADALYASNEKAKSILNWEPKLGLDEIIKSALLWHKNNPIGYSS